MKPRIKLLTIGVDDLNASLAFYRDGLGLPTEGIVGTEFEDGAVVFFEMNDDLILALYPRPALAKDAGIPVGSPSPTEFTIGHACPPRTRSTRSCSRRQRLARG